MQHASLTTLIAASPAVALRRTTRAASLAAAFDVSRLTLSAFSSEARGRSPLRSPAATRRPPTRLVACRCHRERLLLVCNIIALTAVRFAVFSCKPRSKLKHAAYHIRISKKDKQLHKLHSPASAYACTGHLLSSWYGGGNMTWRCPCKLSADDLCAGFTTDCVRGQDRSGLDLASQGGHTRCRPVVDSIGCVSSIASVRSCSTDELQQTSQCCGVSVTSCNPYRFN